MNAWQRVAIANALGNFALGSGANDEYCKGLLVGVVAVAQGYNRNLSWDTVLKMVLRQLPNNCRKLTAANCPECWLDASILSFIS